MERMLLVYFVNEKWATPGRQNLDSVFEQVGRPNGWKGSFFEKLHTPEEKGALGAILERMASDGLLEARQETDNKETFFQASANVKRHPRYDYLFPRYAHSDQTDKTTFSDKDKRELQHKIDSTNWTGLAIRISQEDAVLVREKSKALQQAIMQSDADIHTRTDACKRVEAVTILLEAPNVPWSEVVRLLNHPTVTAFMLALNILQLLVSIAN